MARRLRCYVPGVPTHVVQRGNNRQPCFFSSRDYTVYREFLSEALRRYGASLHAYVLMTNHVHLLMTPSAEDSVSRVMQHVGRLYVAHVNATRGRSGTLWEGRHRSSPVEVERYLFACHRYIELNPVRAGLVRHPGEYLWSSYRCYAAGRPDELVTPHEEFARLGALPEQKQMAWQLLVNEAPAGNGVDEIRQAARRNYPLGDAAFRDRLSASLKRDVGHAISGRPIGARGASKTKMGSECIILDQSG